MKSSPVLAVFAALIALGWIALAHTPARANNPPQCINIGDEQYCLSSYYAPSICVNRRYYGTTYHYCKRHAAAPHPGTGAGY
jgi:hypothetical protein